MRGMPMSLDSLEAFKESLVSVELVTPLALSFRGPQAKRAAEQLILAAESVTSNIAEGYGKGICPDQVRYLKIAHASNYEVEGRLRSAVAARRIEDCPELQLALRQVRRTRSLIQGYMRYVEKQVTASHCKSL